jgi:hypothetical protein
MARKPRLITNIIIFCRRNNLARRVFFFLEEKGPIADAADAPQPYGFLCNPMMKMKITTIVLFQVVEHRWNETDWGKPKYSGKNLSQCRFVHHKSHTD